MFVAPHAGQQGDPAGTAQGRLFAGRAIDATGVGLAVVKPLRQVGGVPQLQVLLQLHAAKANEQGFGLAWMPGRLAARQQGQEQQ